MTYFTLIKDWMRPWLKNVREFIAKPTLCDGGCLCIPGIGCISSSKNKRTYEIQNIFIRNNGRSIGEDLCICMIPCLCFGEFLAETPVQREDIPTESEELSNYIIGRGDVYTDTFYNCAFLCFNPIHTFPLSMEEVNFYKRLYIEEKIDEYMLDNDSHITGMISDYL